ncbi:MAG: ABC transporter permease [Candidatus Hodarchaeales archaeon]|jgi:ABC-type transport system involved in multi-copper enzyme maturation permease subunit
MSTTGDLKEELNQFQNMLLRIQIVYNSISSRINAIILIFQQEFGSAIKKSWKIRILLFLLILPFLASWLLPQSLTPEDFDRYLAIDRLLNYFGIINVDVVSLIMQILLIISSAELLAREIEDDTLQLLIVKPINRSEIFFGKVLGLYLPIMILYSLSLLLEVINFSLKFNWSIDETLNRMISSWLPVVAVGCIGFGILILVTVFLSLLFSRSIYGALVSLIFFLVSDLFFVNDSEWRFKYQLGIVIEEMVDLGKENLYKANDPLLILGFLIFTFILIINMNLILLYRKELP